MSTQTMNYDEAQNFAKRFADHAYAVLDYEGWNVVIPTGAEETLTLPSSFENTPAWEAHNTIVSGGETLLQEWADNNSDYSSETPLLVLARAYNLETDWHKRYRELYNQKALEQNLPITKEQLAELNQITYLDYKSKRDTICYTTMQEVNAEFDVRQQELNNSFRF
jgi:hypothetical protein